MWKIHSGKDKDEIQAPFMVNVIEFLPQHASLLHLRLVAVYLKKPPILIYAIDLEWSLHYSVGTIKSHMT